MSRFLSIDWFKEKLGIKSLEEKQIEQLKEVKEQQIAILDKLEYITSKILPGIDVASPIKTARFNGDTIIVTTKEGEVLEKTNATKEDWEKITTSTSLVEIVELLVKGDDLKELSNRYDDELKQITETKKAEVVIEKARGLEDTGDFEIIDDAVYMKNINRSLPKLLIEKFLSIVSRDNFSTSNEYIGLKRFWMWCCLNPQLQVADWLYDFLHQGDFKITKDGMFLAYRRVVRVKEKDSGLVGFVSNAYVKIKTIWKKKPSNFFIYKSSEGELKMGADNLKLEGEWAQLGNLQELYDNLANNSENRFTDNYSKTIDIRIGVPVSMPRADCNFTTVDCGVGGFHFANHQFNYYCFGDTGILMLVNPYSYAA